VQKADTVGTLAKAKSHDRHVENATVAARE
jgi:hypothetical protein